MARELARSSLAEIETRIRGEFNEMPGLCLTPAQARRLWDVDASTCAGALDDLLRDGFLRRRTDGSFVRAQDATRDVRNVPIAAA
jgi:hypothetical protein